jgi:4-hydroxybenzoyl-CoA thioesterase
MLKHRLSFRVRWSEADPAGIAYYPRFFEWFDLATDALFASVGERWERMFPDNEILGVPIIAASASFQSPVRYGDEVTIESEIVDLTDKTFKIEHRLSVGSTLCATGTEHRAWVGRPARPGDRLRAKPIPEPIKRKLRGDSA